MPSQPKVFHVGRDSQEIPAEWVERRFIVAPVDLDLLRSKAVEVSPGVYVALLSTGNHLLPDKKFHWGAHIAVWDDRDD